MVVPRLTASGASLLDNDGHPVVLQGVNMYLEWYKSTFAAVRAGSSALDVRTSLDSGYCCVVLKPELCCYPVVVSAGRTLAPRAAGG